MITIPTISELYNDILASLEAEYNSSIPVFGKIFLRALAAVQAGKLKLYYLAIGNLQKNIFVDTAESESIGGTLERFGRVKLGRNPFAAVAGEYTVQVTGTTGATIPAQTTFKSNDDSLNPGELYVLDLSFTLDGTNIITIRALTAGLDAKLEIGDELTATAPIANVDSLVTVLTESTEPQAAEELEAYRTKALNAYQQEPQGGAAADYRLWASDAQGVAQSYPYTKSGVYGEVNLYVESTDNNGVPSAAILSAVEAVVDLDPDTTKPISDRGRRPINDTVNYLAVTTKLVDVIITGYVDLTAAKQTTILSAVTSALADIRPYVAGADILADRNDTVSVNKLIFTVQNAQNDSVFTSLTLKVDAVSVNSYQFTEGDIPLLNSITYV